MGEIERFKLIPNMQHNTYDIIDKEERFLTVYNDLGHFCCSSAPAICDKLNEYENEVIHLKEEKKAFVNECRMQNKKLHNLITYLKYWEGYDFGIIKEIMNSDLYFDYIEMEIELDGNDGI